MTLIASLAMNLPTISTDCKTGPRECLCPELELDERIEYPYYGNNGILIKSFDQKLVFNNLENEPLNESEVILFELMLKMLDNPDLVKKYTKDFKFDKKMDKLVIIEEWMKLINI